MLINALSMSATLPTRRGWAAIRISCHNKSGAGQTYSLKELRVLSGEAQLPTVPMTSDTAPSPLVASASVVSGGFEAWRAFDGNTGTYWDSGVTEGMPWLQVYFGPGSSIGISGVIMTSGFAGGAPSSFSVLGSQDLANWTQIAFPFGISWSNDETKTITW
ncbi:discoidin domain-containing protein (plasmid) [Azospirillum sp. HJ39]|uniref:discoidin domain-containing protein n=1 Tax=Azospirillum sp. HJ39 TaxID=3159496 RepID=UPI0035574487